MPRRKKYSAVINWNGRPDERVILPICPRSPGVRGRNFLTTVQGLIHDVKHIHVVMCDTLDRHNTPGRDAETVSRNRGTLWLRDNLPVLEQCGISYDIRRWDEVMADPLYKKRLVIMESLYERNDHARTAVDNVASYYLSAKRVRAAQSGQPFEAEKEKMNSVAYLLDEFAGTATYASWYPGVREAYWGIYIGNPYIFSELNDMHPEISLVLPETCAVHLNRLPPPSAGEQIAA